MQPERAEMDDPDPNSEAVAHSHCFTCQTGLDGIRTVLGKINDLILETGSDLKANCELVLAEVLNNIEEHSYAGQDGCKIDIHVIAQPGTILVETRDEGVPMPGLVVPEKRLPHNKVARDALPEGGFGWYLIHELAPNPIYVRKDDINYLRFKLSNIPVGH